MATINTPSLSELIAAYKLPALDVQQPIQNFVAAKTLKQQQEEAQLKNILEQAKQKLQQQEEQRKQFELGASLTTPEELTAKKFEGVATPEKAKLFVEKPPQEQLGIGDYFRYSATTAEGYPIAQNRKSGILEVVLPTGAVPYNPDIHGQSRPMVAPQLQGSEIDIANATRDILAKTADVEKTFKPEYTGPIQGRSGRVGQALDIGATPEKAVFYQDLAFIKDRIIKLITGAALSKEEAERIMRELPDETKADVDFSAKLKNFRSAVKQSFIDRSKRLASQGIRNAYIPTDEELSALTNRPGQGVTGGLTPEKQRRLEELRAKKAAGTLR